MDTILFLWEQLSTKTKKIPRPFLSLDISTTILMVEGDGFEPS